MSEYQIPDFGTPKPPATPPTQQPASPPPAAPGPANTEQAIQQLQEQLTAYVTAEMAKVNQYIQEALSKANLPGSSFRPG